MKNGITSVELAERLEAYILMLALFLYGEIKADSVAIVLAVVLFVIRICLNHLHRKRISLQDKMDDLQKTKGPQ